MMKKPKHRKHEEVAQDGIISSSEMMLYDDPDG